MQSEVPTLPVVVRPDGIKRFTGNSSGPSAKKSPVEIRNHNTCCKTTSSLVPNGKQLLHPLVGGPYRNSMRFYALSEPVGSTNKTNVGQRVMSAKMLRVKQLQNQLSDAHYHLNELATENRLLRALQKRQDSALRKYEGTNAELPRIINSHHEELKVLQTKHKKLRVQHKQTCELLKEKENEIYSLQSQNKHLVQLSKDRNLEEREKLQNRVSDLNFRIQQQQETIQTLNRKLALESKSLKHQLNVEVSRHKETQKNLQDALDKLRGLEDLLDNREKRLYYNGRLPVYNKAKAITSQSLMCLEQNGLSNVPKSGSKSRELQIDADNGSLPKLTKSELIDGKSMLTRKIDGELSSAVTETMSSLQQVRKFRLQKSYSRGASGVLSREQEKSVDDEEDHSRTEMRGIAKLANIEKLRERRIAMNEEESENEEIKEIVASNETTNGPYKLPEDLMREFGCSSSDSDSENDSETRDDAKLEALSMPNKSRDLHARLINDPVSRDYANPDDKRKGENSSSSLTSESETEENRRKKISSIGNDYSWADGKRDGIQDPIDIATHDFVKLDISDEKLNSEMEKIRKKSLVTMSHDSALDSSENSETRFSTITKSCAELRSRILREREISDNQLKSLTDGFLSEEFLSENILVGKNEFFDSSYEISRESTGKNAIQSEENDDDIAIQARENGIQLSEDEYSSTIQPEYKDIERITNICKTTTKPSVQERERSEEKSLENEASPKIKISNDEKLVDVKIVNYNKQKLLAAMKAIDDNENIEFIGNPKLRPPEASNVRSQSSITENLYRGIPTHARKKDHIMKELFGEGKTENKLRAGCSKLH